VRTATALGRSSAALLAVGIAAAALTGCSSEPNADCSAALKSGPASSLVTATGPIGTEPKISVPTPVDTTTSQRTILTTGTGRPVQNGQMIEIQYTLLDGQTGQVGQKGSYGGDTTPITIGNSNAAISDGLLCAPVGSRVAVAISPKDSGGAGSGSTTILVADIIHAYLPAANGEVRPSISGFPSVALAPNGQPGITIPSSGGAPKTVRTETLKAGDGATVKKDSQVILHYTAVGWQSKNVVMSSWQSKSPDIVSMSTGQSALNQALPQEVLKPLVGQKVGSQLVIEAPAKGSVPAAAWVVDILGVR
jgi:hypothetical protein